MKNCIPKARSVQQVAAVVLGLVLLTGVNACKKDMGAGGGGETVVQIQMLGSESSRGSNPLQRGPSQTGSISRSVASQVITVPFGEENTLTISLEEVGGFTNTSGSGRDLVQQRAAVGRGGDQRASSTNTDGPEPLANGTQWGLMVYDENGVRVSNKTYTHNQDYSNAADTVSGLEIGKAYTFVSYSINGATLPAITGGENLATAITAMTKADLMFQRQDITITSGMNTLQVLLKHQFSLITPKISVATSSNNTVWGGEITSVGPASFVSRTGGQVRFEDGSLTFQSGTENKPVAFTDAAGTGQEFTADPVLVLNPADVPGGFTIQGLTINDITQDVVIDENSAQQLNIEPGKHYNMNMTFNAPCIEQVGTNDFWVHYNVPGLPPTEQGDVPVGEWRSWSTPDADFGFILDIHTLDNSVELEINGVSVFETRRTYQYRTRTIAQAIAGTWPNDWVTVTQTQTTNATTRSVSSNVSRPLFWDWTSSDIDFQHSAKAGEDIAITNVQFADGEVYGSDIPDEGYLGVAGAIRPLWDDTYWNGVCCQAHQPSPNGAIIRLQVLPNGTVKILGKRTANGAFEEMQIIPTQTSRAKHFATNTIGAEELTDSRGGAHTHLREERAILETRVTSTPIVWNSTGGNTVRARQRIVGRTWMFVDGYGLRRIVCNP